MTILILEHPRILSLVHFNDIANTPLWSCLMGGYGAAILKESGLRVKFLNAAEKRWNFVKTKEAILEISPSLLSINGIYLWEHTGRFFDFIADLKTSGFNGHINLFGFFPTLTWRKILERYPQVDSITVGEHEKTLDDLAKCMENGGAYQDIPGLAVRKENSLIYNNKRQPEVNPDGFPFPARDLEGVNTASILASRGCYNHCSFCPIPNFYNNGPLWRGRSPYNIFKEIKELVDLGIRDFYFVDPNFVGPGKKGKKRIIQLAELLAPLEITFGMETRANDLDNRILESLVKAGLKSLLLGIESGSTKILEKLNKTGSLNTSEKAIGLCRSFGIEPEIGFLMFTPDCSIIDIQNNFEFLLRNNLLDRLERTANLLSHYQIVLKGTAGYNLFKTQGRLKKIGDLGFEGEIIYADNAVEWLKEVVVHLCRDLLYHMGQVDSLIHWQCSDDNKEIFKKINDVLIHVFKELLNKSQKGRPFPDPEITKNDMRRFLYDFV